MAQSQAGTERRRDTVEVARLVPDPCSERKNCTWPYQASRRYAMRVHRVWVYKVTAELIVHVWKRDLVHAQPGHRSRHWPWPPCADGGPQQPLHPRSHNHKAAGIFCPRFSLVTVLRTEHIARAYIVHLSSNTSFLTATPGSSHGQSATARAPHKLSLLPKVWPCSASRGLTSTARRSSHGY